MKDSDALASPSNFMRCRLVLKLKNLKLTLSNEAVAVVKTTRKNMTVMEMNNLSSTKSEIRVSWSSISGVRN